MQYRSRIEIVAKILKASNGGARRIDIIYKVNMSSAMAREYLDLLVERGLLTRSYGGLDSYRTAEKGFEFLEWYNDIAELFPIELDPFSP